MKKHLITLFAFFSFSAFQMLNAQNACPSVDAGGDQNVCPAGCANLVASVVATGQTTNYSVAPTGYNPFPYGGNPLFIGTDDLWSGAINLPFTFCFYGVNYNQIVLGANGVATFDVGQAGGFCPWDLTAAWPNAAVPTNAIACPWHDIDPSVGGDVYYAVYGTYPCRVFVASWISVPMYNCNNLVCTQQMALFETTNIIETYISNKEICGGWNEGAAIHGIQNAAGNQAVVVPGRNYASQWSTTNDAWRFTPTGPPVFSLTWTDGNGQVIGNGSSINVCPTSTETYTCTMNLTTCAGLTVTISDPVTVNVLQPTVTASNTGPYCPGATIQLSAGNATGTSPTVGWAWSNPNGTPLANTQSVQINNAQPGMAGTYTVTVTTANGCTATAATTVVINNNLNITVSGPNGVCPGQTITLTAAGATSYVWNNGNVGANLNVTTPGIYTVTGTDANGCTGSASYPVGAAVCSENCSNGTDDDGDGLIDCADPDCSTPVQASNTGPYCPGATILLSATAGNAYSWSGPGGFINFAQAPSIPNATPANGGSYTVTVTNGNGCTSSAATNVVVNAAPTVTITGGVLCQGGTLNLVANGSFDVTTYLWSTGDNTNTATINAGGTYSVTVTNGNGCTASASINIVETPTAIAAIAGDLALCAGETTTLTASGGNTYLWSTGDNTASINTDLAGTYNVTVSNNGNCSASASATVVVSPNPTVNILGGVLCAGGTLTLTANASLDVTDYTWSTGETTNAIVVNAGGFYSVVVSNAGACTASASINVNANPPVVANISGDLALCAGETTTLTASGGLTYIWSNGETSASITANVAGVYDVTATDVSGCTGSASANLVVFNTAPIVNIAGDTELCPGESSLLTASGGLTYQWSTGVNAATITVSNAGQYDVTASDANGCTGSASVTVNANPAPLALIVGNTIICQGQTATLTATGGTDYVWSNGETTADITIVSQGVYSVTVTSAAGCTASVATTITQANALVPSITGTTEFCSGGSTVLTANGGSIYSWSNGETTGSVTATAGGVYVVTVSDVAGCSGTAAITVTEFVPPIAFINGPTGFCAGESATLVAGGGATYLWSTGSTSPTINVNVAGTYTVTATSAVGCTGSASFTIGQNAIPAATVSYNAPLTCVDDLTDLVLSVSVAGGGGPYTYWWTGPGGFMSPQESPVVPNVTAANSGTYIVQVTDANGCSAPLAAVVVEITEAPETPLLGANTPICEGETLNLTASGGLGLTYAWSGPFGYTSVLQNPSINNVVLLNAGLYSVVVTNGAGCTATEDISVAVVSVPLPSNPVGAVLCAGALAGPLDGLYVDCVGNTVTWWDAPFGGNMVGAGSPFLPVGYENFAPGTYLYYAECTTNVCAGLRVAVSLTILEAPATPVITANGPLCSGSQATLSVAPAAGATYQWYFNANPIPGATGSSLVINPVSPANAGYYTVDVTMGSCSAISQAYLLEVYPGFTVDAANDSRECMDPTEDIHLTATVNGGTGPYTFEWSGVGTNGFVFQSYAQNPVLPNVVNDYSGTYFVSVTDANGCVAVDSSVVDATVTPQLPLLTGNTPLCEGEDLTLQVPVYPTNSVEYHWILPNGTDVMTNNNVYTIPSATLSDAGVYSAYVVVDGCTSDTAQAVTVVVNPVPVINQVIGGGSYCEGQNIALSAVVTNGAGATYTWTGPNGFSYTDGTGATFITNATVNQSGVYTLWVETAAGCAATPVSLSVQVSPQPAVPVLSTNSPLCSGGILLLNTAAYNGQTVSYEWFYNGVSLATTNSPQYFVAGVTPANSGFYTVQVTVNGCNSQPSAPVLVNVYAAPTAAASVNGPICEGENLYFDVPFNPNWSYSWSGPAGFTSNLRNPVVVNAGVANAGTYILVVTDNTSGCTVQVNVVASINAMPAMPVAANNSPVCVGGSINLYVSTGTTPGATYTWYNALTNALVGSSPLPDGSYTIAGMAAGTYSYYVVATSAAGCVSETSLPTTVLVDNAYALTANAGVDLTDCGTGATVLAGTLAPGQTGLWLVPGAATLADPTDPQTSVSNLNLGENIFIWSVTSGACPGTAYDTVTVMSETSPVALADSFGIDFNEQAMGLDLVANDDANGIDQWLLTITSQPEHGAVTNNFDGTVNYEPALGFYGTDTFAYTICSQSCPGLCSTALVTITVGEAGPCHVPNVFTPNGDGTNEFVVIPCLDLYTNNQLRVFNRWGDEVFMAKPYMNDWAGTFSGQNLPEGTYFYLLTYYDELGVEHHTEGYFMLHR